MYNLSTLRILVLGLCLCLLASPAIGQKASSSSSKASSSSSSAVASSSSSAVASSSSIQSGLILGSDCKAVNKVGDDPCAAVNKDWCCYYTSSQVGDGAKYEAWTCTTNPSVLSDLLSSASSLVSKATTDSSSEAKVEAYCAMAEKIMWTVAGSLLFVGSIMI